MAETTAVKTLPGVDTRTQVPAATMAEFGKRELDTKAKAELAAMEAAIEAQLQGKSVPPAPAQPQQAAPAQPQSAPATTAPTAAAEPAQTAPEPAQAQQAPPPAPAEIPDKFKTPEGTLDESRLNKSVVELEKYLAMEKELSKVKAAQAAPQTIPQMPYGYPGMVVPPPVPNQGMPQYPQTPYLQAPYGVQQAPMTFEQKFNQDLSVDPGTSIIALTRAVQENIRQESQAKVSELEAKLELMELARQDPGILTQSGFERLVNIRQQNPWLSQSPTPWLHAYKLSGGVPRQTPAPYAAQATAAPQQPRTQAPVLPGGSAPATLAQAPAFDFTSEAALRGQLNQKFGKDYDAQAKFLEDAMNAMLSKSHRA